MIKLPELEGVGINEHVVYEEKLALLNMAVESAGIGTWVFDLARNKRYFDSTASLLLGFSPAEFKRTKKEFLDRIHPDDRAEVRKQLFNRLVVKSDIRIDFRSVWTDGTVRFLTAKAKAISDNAGKPVRLIGLIWDVTDEKLLQQHLQENIRDRKNTEVELKSSLEQLQQLAQHIEEVREDERVAISRELHDDLGQALTAVKIDLAAIKQNVSDMATVLKINKTSALVSDTIKTVQRLTSQLRPQIIDDLGLGTAIEWYAKEFEERNRIKIFLDLDSNIVIAPDVSLVIFRIMQEGLTNIARYSGASTAKISMENRRENIEFSISDNGIGIAEEKIFSKKSFGIISMKERAASLGGQIKILRENDRFTVIKLIFPLKNRDKNDNSDL